MRHSINQSYRVVIQKGKVGTLTKSIYYGMSRAGRVGHTVALAGRFENAHPL